MNAPRMVAIVMVVLLLAYPLSIGPVFRMHVDGKGFITHIRWHLIHECLANDCHSSSSASAGLPALYWPYGSLAAWPRPRGLQANAASIEDILLANQSSVPSATLPEGFKRLYVALAV